MAILLKVLVFLTVIYSASAATPPKPPIKCTKPNQIYSNYANNPCIATCEVPRIAICGTSLPKKIPGCICKPGYLINAAGNCIPEKQCFECADKPNQEFSEYSITPCDQTCEFPRDGTCPNDIKLKVPGCVCKKGYLKNKEGNCILDELCRDCANKPNEVYSECKNYPCQNTCENPRATSVCNFSAGCYPGCICRDGFLRNAQGVCVDEDECPPECPEGEHYEECGTACPTTCDNKDGPLPGCPDVCVEGCFCDEGLVRDTKSGLCIPPEDCPPKCPANEEYIQCGTPCPITCKNKDNPPNPKDCRKICVPGCFCVKPYIRNEETGKCVLPKQCPTTKCGLYEFWSLKCPIAPETCDSPEYPKYGTVAGCCCKPPNYIREYQGGKCVHRNTCV